MGSRDIRRREVKKPKKDNKKPGQMMDVLQSAPPAEVEVIRTKGKKPREEEE